MKKNNKQNCQPKPQMRCAIYTRTATTQQHGELAMSLAAQREAAEAFIAKQQHRGWLCLPARYDDDGQSGVSLDRPGLQRLLADIRAGKIDYLVIYRFDRLTRSLSDLAHALGRLRETRHDVGFRNGGSESLSRLGTEAGRGDGMTKRKQTEDRHSSCEPSGGD